MRFVVVVASALIVSSCNPEQGAPADPAPPIEFREASEAPPWSVRYGAELWRERRATATTVDAAGVRVSPALDLGETIERVEHAFRRDANGAVRSQSATYSVAVDGAAVRFVPAQSTTEATIAVSSIERGDIAWRAVDGGEAFVLGNTMQRRLAFGDGAIVEHVESRAEGVELTWVLPEPLSGDGPLGIALAIEGMSPVGRTASGHHFADATGIARMRVSDVVVRDAAGGEWQLVLEEDAAGLRLEVPADILAAARYPVAIDPIVSAELGIDIPIAGGPAGGSSGPRIACGAGTCLVVWADNRTGDQAVRAARLDPATGEVLDPFGIEIVASGGHIDVAFDGQDFLVVYSTTRIYVQRVTLAGETAGPPVQIGAGSYPVIASNGSTSMVAYYRPVDTARKQDVFAVVLSGTTILASDIVVAGSALDETRPKIAWDGQGFVIVWEGYNGTDADVWIARLAADGTSLSPPAVLAGGSNHQTGQNVCGASDGGALVVWEDYAGSVSRAQRLGAAFSPEGSPISLGNMGTLLACAADATGYLVAGSSRRNRIDKATGALLAPAPGLSNPSSWTFLDVEAHGNQFVAAYSRHNVTYDSFVTRIASDGSLVDSSPIPVATPVAGQTLPAIAFDGANHLVVWSHATGTGPSVRGVLLDGTGAAVDPAGLELAQGASFGPVVAYGDGRYLVAWVASSTLKAVRVRPDGTLEDTTPITMAVGTSSQPRIAFDGSRFVAVWHAYLGSYNVYAATLVAETGAVASFAVTEAPDADQYPSIACLPTGRCLVAWQRGGGQLDVVMARIDSGALIDTTALPLATTSVAESYPRVTTDGASFFVAYRGANSARRVGAGGELLDASPIPLGMAPYEAWFDGTNYVVSNGDSTSLVVGQVTPSGTVRNPGGLAVATSSYPLQDVAASRTANPRGSLVVYSVYDDSATIQNRRIKARFVEFMSAPVGDDISVSTFEDTSTTISLSASDPDGDPTTYTIASVPSHGTLSGTPPNLTYTPDPDFNGADSFTFKANDGDLESAAATVHITVIPVNDAPVASDASVTTAEDSAASVTLVASDVDGDALEYVVVTPPAHGTLSGTAPDLVYTPNADFHGTDSFTWSASDGALSSNTATVTITVTAVNDAPVAHDQQVMVAEDAAVSITLTGSDVDGDALTFSVVTGPAHGTLAGTPPNLVYTPAPDFAGSDSFTFAATDGALDSAPATVDITVTPVNDAPVALAQTVMVDQGQSVSILLSATDVDGDALTYEIVELPAHGTLTGTPPNLTYTAPTAFQGETTFTFVAIDGVLSSEPATVTIQVHPDEGCGCRSTSGSPGTAAVFAGALVLVLRRRRRGAPCGQSSANVLTAVRSDTRQAHEMT